MTVLFRNTDILWRKQKFKRKKRQQKRTLADSGERYVKTRGEQREKKPTNFIDSVVSRICISIPVSEALEFCFSPAVFLIILACFLITCSHLALRCSC